MKFDGLFSRANCDVVVDLYLLQFKFERGPFLQEFGLIIIDLRVVMRLALPRRLQPRASTPIGLELSRERRFVV